MLTSAKLIEGLVLKGIFSKTMYKYALTGPILEEKCVQLLDAAA